ncbi:MAG: hypothetical protein AAGF76_01110 [Pseudomonadota bacterium]
MSKTVSKTGRSNCESKVVAIGRTGSTPLRFRGRPTLRRHYRTPGLEAFVGLWDCGAKGMVVHLELTSASERRSFAERVGSPSEALRFFDTLVSKVPQSTLPKLRRDRRNPVEDVATLLLTRSRNLEIQAGFTSFIEDMGVICEGNWPGHSENTNPVRVGKAGQ